ncbi:MAG TPA: peroxiredoxin-like family protein [Flavipsychrobacter sp.]
MKWNSVILLILLSFGINTYAQLPETAEDICPILIGEKIPDITLVNTDNQQASITGLLKEQPTVLIFYRGGWCPYCNAHLAEIADIEQEIIAAGYKVIAISPDAPDKLNLTVDKKELKYTLLSDSEGKLSAAMGIAFKAPDSKWKTNQLQKYSGGKNPGFLPVPSVFVFNKKGEVMFEHIDPNYRQRLDGKLLMAVLNALK